MTGQPQQAGDQPEQLILLVIALTIGKGHSPQRLHQTGPVLMCDGVFQCTGEADGIGGFGL